MGSVHLVSASRAGNAVRLAFARGALARAAGLAVCLVCLNRESVRCAVVAQIHAGPVGVLAWNAGKTNGLARIVLVATHAAYAARV